MSPVIVTYIGFVVAAFILLWGFVVVGRRYFVRKRKVDQGHMDVWIPLKPTPIEIVEDADEDERDESSGVDHHTHAQQNGHYTGSKNKL